MCGIWFAKVHNKKHSALIQHRGPDTTTTTIHNEYAFVFHRLAINDLTSDGNQPLKTNNTTLMCNGEIYNHSFLKSELDKNTKFIGQSDCEPMLHMLDSNIDKKYLCNSLDGVFAIVAMKDNIVLAAFKSGDSPIPIEKVSILPKYLAPIAEIKLESNPPDRKNAIGLSDINRFLTDDSNNDFNVN